MPLGFSFCVPLPAFRSWSPALSQVQPHLPVAVASLLSSDAFCEPRLTTMCGVSTLAGPPLLGDAGGGGYQAVVMGRGSEGHQVATAGVPGTQVQGTDPCSTEILGALQTGRTLSS